MFRFQFPTLFSLSQTKIINIPPIHIIIHPVLFYISHHFSYLSRVLPIQQHQAGIVLLEVFPSTPGLQLETLTHSAHCWMLLPDSLHTIQVFHIVLTEAAHSLSGHLLKKAGLEVSNPTSTYYSFHGMQQSVLFQSSAYYWFIRWYDKIVNDFYSNLHASSHFLIFWEGEERKKSKNRCQVLSRGFQYKVLFPLADCS